MTPAPQVAMPTAPARSWLAFDFGTRRIGVASGNSVTQSATPLHAINNNGNARFDAIEALIKAWQPHGLVVGVPRHPDGQPHAMTQKAERFARQLQGRFGLPVTLVDERYSSVEAQSRGGHDNLDAQSAAVILEQHLRSLA